MRWQTSCTANYKITLAMMKYYFRSALYSLLLLVSVSKSIAQNKQSSTLSPFEKVTVSPHIKLFLEEGSEETVTIKESKVPLEKINIKVEGKNLLIYLDDAKITTKQIKQTENGHTQSVPIYKGTQVTAHVTYKTLKDLSIRGEETATCLSPLKEKELTINLYGESHLLIDSIETKELKATLYGDNHLTINRGSAISQSFKSYGESEVNVQYLINDFSKVTAYGSSTFNLNTKDKIKVWAFGEARINYLGDPEIQRSITIGDLKIVKLTSPHSNSLN